MPDLITSSLLPQGVFGWEICRGIRSHCQSGQGLSAHRIGSKVALFWRHGRRRQMKAPTAKLHHSIVLHRGTNERKQAIEKVKLGDERNSKSSHRDRRQILRKHWSARSTYPIGTSRPTPCRKSEYDLRSSRLTTAKTRAETAPLMRIGLQSKRSLESLKLSNKPPFGEGHAQKRNFATLPSLVLQALLEKMETCEPLENGSAKSDVTIVSKILWEKPTRYCNVTESRPLVELQPSSSYPSHRKHFLTVTGPRQKRLKRGHRGQEH